MALLPYILGSTMAATAEMEWKKEKEFPVPKSKI